MNFELNNKVDMELYNKDQERYKVNIKKADFYKLINNLYDNEMKEIASKYPAAERDTWSIQQTEWSRWVNDPTNAKTPFVDSLAEARGVDRTVLLTRIGDKVNQIAVLLGKKQALESQVKQVTTLKDLEAINISF